MLEKTPGNFNVEKLRIILLFEADFNANNKWIGRAVMFNTETNDLLVDEQYRSRRNKAAVLQCLNKGLFYDLLWQVKKPAALCLNDAKSCYDRITLLAAALCLCRLGAPINAVKCMTTTIHGMNHHIRTIYGDLQQSANRTSWAAPIAGIGQGNGAGPSIWAAVSSPMFEVMRQEGFYALLQGAISLQYRTIAGFTFVDDTDLCVTHPTDQVNQVAGHMQKAVTLWEGLLRATGGALVPEKCFWYLVAFEHSNNKWKYLKCNQAPGNITILDTDRHPNLVQRLEPYEAQRTLGVRLAPGSNMETELDYLLDVVKDWQRKMKNSKLGRWESMFSLRNVLLRKLVYPLLATTFTKEQCQIIMSPILAQGLPLAGFIRTFPHALAHGPLKFCGINIPNLFTEQTLAHIHTLLKFSHQAQDLMGFLLRASGETMRLELGWTGQLFEAPLILQELITDSWLKHTWLATREADIHLMINIPDFPLQCHGDQEIVHAFLQHGFRQPQLGALHRCRMFLQVLRLSDLCTGTGDRLLTSDWRKYQPLPSCYHWPKAVKPSTAD